MVADCPACSRVDINTTSSNSDFEKNQCQNPCHKQMSEKLCPGKLSNGITDFSKLQELTSIFIRAEYICQKQNNSGILFIWSFFIKYEPEQ